MSLSPSEQHRRSLLKILGAVAVGATLLYVVSEADRRTRPHEALDAVPQGAFLVATADITSLRRSPIYAALFGDDGGRALGLGAVESACGFDPTARIQKAVFVIPEEGDKGEFGVAATLDVTPDEIKLCAQKLAEARHEDGDTSLSKQGDFYVMQGKGESLPRLAFKPESAARGLLLVGKGSMVDAMMDASSGKRPRMGPESRHMLLRTALSKVPTPSVLVTAILPESTRARVRTEMLPELERSNAGSKDLMSGVLSVSTAGAALVAGEEGGTTELRAVLDCEAADACSNVKTLIERKRLELGKNFALRLFAGPLLDSLTVEQEGARLIVRTAVPTADAARLIGRTLDLRKGDRRRTDPLPGFGGPDEQDDAPRGRDPAQNPRFRKPRAPDETLPSKLPSKNDASSSKDAGPR